MAMWSFFRVIIILGSLFLDDGAVLAFLPLVPSGHDFARHATKIDAKRKKLSTSLLDKASIKTGESVGENNYQNSTLQNLPEPSTVSSDNDFEDLEDVLYDEDDEDSDCLQLDGDDDNIPSFDISLSDLDLQQALSSNVSYFYLRNEIGLSEDIMWKITHDAASVLGMTADNIRRKVQVLVEKMNLSNDDVKFIVERQPTILQLSADNNLSPKLEWIQTSLRLSTDELRYLILSQPSILTYAMKNLNKKLQFFTSARGLKFTIKECRQLVLAEPKLWTAGVKSGLLPRARFFIHELEIPKKSLRLALKKNPRILLYSVQDNLVPKLIHYGIMTLHMEPATDIQKLLTKYPQFLDKNLERTIEPITEYFRTELDYSAHEFRNIFLKCPRIFSHSLQKMKHVVGFLRFQAGLDAASVKRVLYQAPQVLELDTKHNLAPKLEYLQKAISSSDSSDNGNDEEQLDAVRTIIAGMPTILNLSVESNLQPKIEYLKQMLQTDANGESLQDILLRMPALLGYSLDKRIQPRMEKIVQCGLPPANIRIGITMTEENFRKWLEGKQKKKAKRAIVLASRSPTLFFETEEVVTPSSKSNKDRSGRIVHWTRERKRPAQESGE